MSHYTSGEPHPPPSPSTATQLPPVAFKHCRSSNYSRSSHSVPGDPKAYSCRFHGGTGDGCQATQKTSAVTDRRREHAGGGMKKGENQQNDYEEEIPIEMLLPSEWTY